MIRPFLAFGFCLVLGVCNVGVAEDLPADAQALVDQHRKSIADIERKAAEQTKAAHEKLQADLEKMKVAYTKDGKLDEAVAIRDFLRAGVTSEPIETMSDPGNLTTYRSESGRVMYIEVIGTTNNSIWGTDVYTHDSNLSTAAVHAGVLKPGEAGIVKVTILKDGGEFKASGRNGVSSGSWNGSNYEGFRVESIKAKKAATPETAVTVTKEATIKQIDAVKEAVKKVDSVKGAFDKLEAVKEALKK
jgi:LCCL domain